MMAILAGWNGDVVSPAAPAGLSAVASDQTVTLGWNANNESDLGGYKVYYGLSQRTCSHPDSNNCGYSNVIDVGNVTSYYINNLIEGQTYYFSITAYDGSGNESDFSEEKSAAITFFPWELFYQAFTGKK